MKKIFRAFKITSVFFGLAAGFFFGSYYGMGWLMTNMFKAFPVALALCLTLSPLAAHALDLGGLAKKATGSATGAARDKAVKEVNAKLLAEGRKNQCSFKTDSDEFAAGCDKKLKKLADTLVDAKKRLNVAGVTSFKFEVSGHTDSSGKPEHNKELSGKRAATIVRDVVVENCRITGNVRIATLKLRPDTPQHYEGITFRNITSEATASAILSVQPWMQYANLQGEAPPQSVVRNLSFIGIKGHYTAFGTIRPNPGQTEISDISFKEG